VFEVEAGGVETFVGGMQALQEIVGDVRRKGLHEDEGIWVAEGQRVFQGRNF